MDRDSFVHRHRADWQRLDDLSRRRHPSPRETDELVRLYLRVSSHLASARRQYADPALLAHLNGLVSRATARVYGTRSSTWLSARRAVTRTFPAAIYHVRRAVLLSFVVFALSFAVSAVWVANSPEALDTALPPEQREQFLSEDFEAYYSEQPAQQFGAKVFTNNAQIGIQAFGSGILLGIPTLLIMAFNGLNVGVVAGAFYSVGDQAYFWGLILPHGFLELTAIFVAGGAGMHVGWAAVSPGDRPRSVAVADAARRAVVIAIGLVVVFFLSAGIEAYVTPSGWATPVRVGFGFLVEVVFLLYTFGLGRLAAQDGLTGAFGETRGT